MGCAAQDLHDAYEEIEDPDTGDITTVVQASESVACEARLPLTVSDLDDGEIIPISPETISASELDALLWPYMFRAARNDGQGIISPDGLDFLSINSTQGTRLEIFYASSRTTAQLLWDGMAGAPNVISRAQWSPSGTTIAIAERVSIYPSGGNIWTQPSDASAAPKKILSATTRSGQLYTPADRSSTDEMFRSRDCQVGGVCHSLLPGGQSG